MKDWASIRAKAGETRERDEEFHYLSFRMYDSFFDNWRDRNPDWGFPIGGGNTLGEYAWITKYSRLKADGTKERFWEGLRRVIEGMYSIQKDHALRNRLPWNEYTAHRSAQEAYARAFAGKWSPPGRGFWMMGTEFVNGQNDSSALQNCAFTSTGHINEDEPGAASKPFSTLMNMSMLGIGVGFDTTGAGKVEIQAPRAGTGGFVIADSREGWCASVDRLLLSYFKPNRSLPEFDYGQIRRAGSPIKGFGGTSAGPRPLRKLHHQLHNLLKNRAGEFLSSTDIVDIMNMIGKCVIAANVRSSAEIALGEADDEAFLSLKDYRVNPERMGADGWGYTSNNSVIGRTGQDYSHLAERMALNGEPGILWLDVVRNHGRLVDGINTKDHRAAGCNPCQPGWSTLLTPNGVCTMEDIQEGDSVWSQDGWVTVVRKTATGVKPVYRYRTTAGFVDATEDHQIVSRGVKVKLSDADSIDRLRGTSAVVPHDEKKILAGLILGDGYVHTTHANDYHVLCIGVNDQDYFDSEVAHLIIGRHGADRAWTVEPVVDAVDLVRLPERTIPEDLIGNASVLRGLFSANGSVVRGRITFKTASPTMRDAVQISLSALGIASYYTTNKPSQIQWANGSYESRESYDVNIGRAQDVLRFAKTIGFLQKYKMDKLNNQVCSNTGLPERSFMVTETEALGDHPVWDITVDGISHTYWSGGLNVSNCGEQPLEDKEMCTLVESYPTRCDDLADYLRTLKFAYLYGKTVTLLMTKWPETNEVMIRNRRIGTSMTGIAQFAEQHGWAELRKWQDEGYREIRRWDEIYSEWLGVRESIRVTTVKPSGTVSLLFGVTPGCHWPKESGHYIRTVRENVNSPIVNMMKDAGYRVEPSVSNPDTTMVISLPTEGPKMRSESEVTIWEKASLAAQCQRYWSDNSVSVTLTFDAEKESDQIAPVLGAFDGQLKSVSFLPMTDGIYAQAPYQKVSLDRWTFMTAGLGRLDWDSLYDGAGGQDAEGELYCSTDSCEIRAKE